MKLEPLQIEQIETYLQGNLEGEALKNFEAKLKNEAEFAKEVEIFKQIFTGIEQKGALDFEEKLLAWDEEEAGANTIEEPKEEKGKVVSMRRYYAIAAAVLLLLLPLGWFLLKGSTSPSNQQLYASHYKSYADQHRGLEVQDDKDPKVLLKKGIDLYFKQQYSASTQSLNAFLRNASDELSYEQTEAQFYLAMTAQESDNPAKALLLLNEVVNSKHDYYKADALWYLGLINLQQNNAPAAKNSLEKLLKDYPDYKRISKAKKILKSIKKKTK